MDTCKNCLTPVETADGVIDLNDNGECENCAENRELCRVLDEDERREKNFDYSMNG